MDWIKIGPGHVMPRVWDRVLCTVELGEKLYTIVCKYYGKVSNDYKFISVEDWFRDLQKRGNPYPESPKYLAWMPVPKPYMEF